MVLERAILRLQSHVCGGAEHVPEASLRHDGLATLADSILASPPVERGESKAGPSQLLAPYPNPNPSPNPNPNP